MSKRWRYLLVLGYPLLALNALLGLTYAIVWCRATSWQWRSGVLTFVARRPMVYNPIAQGWSWLIGFKDEEHRKVEHIMVHECCHVVQEMIFGIVGLGAGVVTYALTGALKWSLPVGLTSGGIIFMIAYGVLTLGGYEKNPLEVQAFAREEAYRRLPLDARLRIWGDE